MKNQFEGRGVRLMGQDFLEVYIPVPLQDWNKWGLAGMQAIFVAFWIFAAWITMRCRRFRN